jgi:AcrR family transcriptional regulator
MNKEKYHHGTLRKDLIENGLQILNKQGYDGLSLRKVAALCGVSHTAPYKHFQNKDELIMAITKEVTESFKLSLLDIKNKYINDPENQIFEIGKGYVKFMVENPEYLKFLFLAEHSSPIKVTSNSLSAYDYSSFNIFKDSALNYLNFIKVDPKDYTLNILTMWSAVHGISILLANKSISYSDDYMLLVDRMLREKLKFI